MKGIKMENKDLMTDGKKETKSRISNILLLETGTLIFKIILIIFIFLLLFSFVYGVHRVDDQSMRPNITNGDIVIYYRLDRSIVSSDIVAVEQGGKIRIGRVVAVAGDRVDIDQNGLKINGVYVQEEKIYEKTDRYVNGIDFPVTVPPDEVFVLGDGREHSSDSRIYGCVSVKDIYGKVIATIRKNV